MMRRRIHVALRAPVRVRLGLFGVRVEVRVEVSVEVRAEVRVGARARGKGLVFA